MRTAYYLRAMLPMLIVMGLPIFLIEVGVTEGLQLDGEIERVLRAIGRVVQIMAMVSVVAWVTFPTCAGRSNAAEIAKSKEETG